MADNPFQAGPPDPQLTMLGMVADISSIRSMMVSNDRRLEALEKAVSKNEELLKAVLNVQNQANSNSTEIAKLNVRCETIDKNVDALSGHDIRIKNLEENLIKNGELRMNKVESFNGKVVTALGTGLVGLVGFIKWDMLVAYWHAFIG